MVTQTSRWDDVGTTIPPNEAKYVVGNQPVAEYDNKHNNDVVTDITNIIAALDAITKTLVVKTIPDDGILSTGDGKAHFTVPVELNGYDLVTVGAHVYTASTSGLPTFMVHNLTDTVDMLTTAITIDANENDSMNAATPPVIDTTNDDVVTGDALRFDCDLAGTGTRGMEVRLGFRLP